MESVLRGRVGWKEAFGLSRRWNARRFVVFVLSLSFISCLVPTKIAADEPQPKSEGPDLAEIIDCLNEWRNSFVNLDLEWQKSNDSDEAISRGVPSPFVRQRWVWADHGIFAHEIKNFIGGQHGSLDVWNLPKELSFRATYVHKPEEGEFLDKLEVHRIQGSRPTSWLAVTPLQGLYFVATAKWLGEHLRDWDVELDGYEAINGHRCVRVLPAELEGATLWLDVEHDFLVRRYLTPSIPGKQREVDFAVSEFQQLDTGRWFPESGSADWKGDDAHYTWRVTSIALNKDVDPEDWLPPRPEVGTRVIDMRVGSSFRVAHEGDRDEVYEKIIHAANSNLPKSASQSPAVPLKLLWGGAALVVSILLLVVGRWFMNSSKSVAKE